MREKYTKEAIERSADGAREWLSANDTGTPRSWDQEVADTIRRGYDLYDFDFEAPPIAGYERLEEMGEVLRGKVVVRSGQERIGFRPSAKSQ